MSTGLPPGKTDDDPEWVLDFCNFKKAWSLPPKPGGKSKGEGIIVVHPDTGWTTHPELWDTFRIVDGQQADDRYLTRKSKNFIDPGQPAVDKLEFGYDPEVVEQKGAARYLARPRIIHRIAFSPSHGTATASVILSKSGPPDSDEFPDYPAGPGFVSGVAPLVKVIPYKVTKTVILSAQELIDLAALIHYAVNLSRSSPDPDIDGSQIGVISISLGAWVSMSTRQTMPTALQAARQAGIVVIAAAGQGIGKKTAKAIGVIYPGHDPNTIAAAACNYKHEKYADGCYGSAVDITAPGVNVWEARAKRVPNFPNDYFADQSEGTSYSTAIVAGACALWQAHHGRMNLLNEYGPELIFDLFKKVLKDSCDTPAGWDTANRGAGVLDAEKLLLQPLPPKSEIEKIRGR